MIENKVPLQSRAYNTSSLLAQLIHHTVLNSLKRYPGVPQALFQPIAYLLIAAAAAQNWPPRIVGTQRSGAGFLPSVLKLLIIETVNSFYPETPNM